MADELAELVDDPVERLNVEYKSWLDLTDKKVPADLARHISAISNFGGGSIVFGINDDGTSSGPPPASFALDHDAVAAIVKKYLEPPVHCDVMRTKSKLGIEHPIIQVPTHGLTPICAKRNGPEVNGKIVGIHAGVHYLRKPGPESSPIQTAADWRDVIHRCALHDRSAILAAIAAALSERVPQPKQAQEDLLRLWAEAADKAYAQRANDQNLRAPVKTCRIQLSYRILTEDLERLPFDKFEHLLSIVASEVDQYVRSGWSLFYVFNSESMSPSWENDPSFGEDDFLQTDLVLPDRSLGLDFWRVTTTGFATVIREYWEDTADFGRVPKTTLDPKILTRTLGELVRHAEAFSAKFSTPLRVEFRCEWKGLRGRKLATQTGLPFHTRQSTADAVVTSGSWPVIDLGEKLPEIVEALGGRVARALDWTGLSAELVRSEQANWTR
ncbi:helix-turn-helix domain-containing protein, partial [Phenylobacterium sp.]|uniref:AlbA family DNA-binding domain-containing protein n=1 Tax=Phenylobacterium sp. TaxID=1871053 RepID=UPI0025D7FB20